MPSSLTHIAFYNLKMKYDESDNVVIRASRVVTDRVGETFGGVMTQSDMAEALAEIRKLDPSFSKEEFAQQCQFEIIPTILEVSDSQCQLCSVYKWDIKVFSPTGIPQRRHGSSEGLVS